MKKILLFCLPFIYCLILLFIQDQSFTQDLGRHIKTGEIIWKTQSIPKVNLFSYTEPTHVFINHHWGSEVVFYYLGQVFGLNSLLVLKVLLIFLSFGLIYLLAFKKNPFFAFITSFFYIYLFSYRFDVRPELFSFLFISLFIFMIAKYQEHKKILFLLPLPLFELLWVNSHIYFVLGPLILACLLFAEFVKKKRLDIKALSVFIICSFVTLINPNGIVGALEPFNILKNYGYSIIENQNVFFLNQFFFNPKIFMFEILAVLFVVLCFLNIKKVNLFLLLLGLISVIFGFQMVRNFPIFVLATFVLLAFLLEQTIDKIKDKEAVKKIALVVVLVFVLFTSYNALTSRIVGFSYMQGATNAVDYFESHHLKGPIFNNFDIGSYLIYRMYPAQKVFVDGRPEAYSIKFFDDYKKMQEDPKFFNQQVQKYGINTIFFAHTDITPWAQQFLADIVKNKNWKQVYLDNRIIILTKL